jgi:hypothetical protein
MERRKILSIMGGILVAMLMGEMLVASDPQGTAAATAQREGRRQGRRHGHDGREGRRHHDGRGKQHRSHVHKWKGHKEKQGKLGKAREGNWKNRWHGGRGFDKHRSHRWNKYGWFWEDETKSWYQCTPIDDPQRGYGCEYKGKWYPMEKPASSAASVKEVMKEEDEDIIAPEEAADVEETTVEESYAS